MARRVLTLWGVVELHIDQIKLGALNHVVHDIRGDKTLWGARDNIFTSVPAQFRLLHEVAKGVNELDVVRILLLRTVLDIKVEAINCCRNELSLSIRPWDRVEWTRIVGFVDIAVESWTEGLPEVAGKICSTCGELVLRCRTT